LSDLHVLGILALGHEQKVATLIRWLDAQDLGIIDSTPKENK
jgi:hypothetical protein